MKIVRFGTDERIKALFSVICTPAVDELKISVKPFTFHYSSRICSELRALDHIEGELVSWKGSALLLPLSCGWVAFMSRNCSAMKVFPVLVRNDQVQF